jgi:uncharacterized protein YndB with AHSA1/START domain
MPDAFRITSMVPGLPERVYSAWLDSGAHAAFTGATAKIDPTIGGKFTVLDGTVQGRTVELLPGRRIVQTWRAKEFPRESRDSRLEIQFEGAEGSTRVTIMHSLLPPGHGERQKQAWILRYFQPMRNYFGRLVGGPAASAPSPRGTVKQPDTAHSKPAPKSGAASQKKDASSKTAPKKAVGKAKQPKPAKATKPAKKPSGKKKKDGKKKDKKKKKGKKGKGKRH